VTHRPPRYYQIIVFTSTCPLHLQDVLAGEPQKSPQTKQSSKPETDAHPPPLLIASCTLNSFSHIPPPSSLPSFHFPPPSSLPSTPARWSQNWFAEAAFLQRSRCLGRAVHNTVLRHIAGKVKVVTPGHDVIAAKVCLALLAPRTSVSRRAAVDASPQDSGCCTVQGAGHVQAGPAFRASLQGGKMAGRLAAVARGRAGCAHDSNAPRRRAGTCRACSPCRPERSGPS
jgi:hypothetical protein